MLVTSQLPKSINVFPEKSTMSRPFLGCKLNKTIFFPIRRDDNAFEHKVWRVGRRPDRDTKIKCIDERLEAWAQMSSQTPKSAFLYSSEKVFRSQVKNIVRAGDGIY
jgi:hypothetical protein